MAVRTDKIIETQRLYTETKGRGRSLSLFVPEAFVRGIRHIGYKSNMEAIAELVDNSIQAYSERVDLVFDFARGGSAAKPTQLAVIDDGHGMGPAMLRFAMMWGGTHRENDRGGLGRFGYGLPCATVSMGRRFSIYSKVRRGSTHVVSLDLDLLDSGAYRNSESELEIPFAHTAAPPEFVRKALTRIYPSGWKSGTIIVIDKLDRLDWTTVTGLRRNLVRHLGVAYHKLLPATSIHVDDEQVRPIDPLFLSPEGELYTLDDDRAHGLDPVTIKFECEFAGRMGEVTLRYAWLPPSFGATDKSRDAIGINANARFPILKQYHGIVFSRNGRLVDVQARTPWTTFINNDRYIRVEIEFSATLDEAFGVTTSKQQVSVSPEMWDRLRVAGLPKAIEHLRTKVRIAKATRQERAVPSRAMSTAPKVPPRTADIVSAMPVSNDRRRSGSKGADELVATIRRAISKCPPDEALDALLTRIRGRMADGDAETIAEYERLLQEWAAEFAPPINGSGEELVQDEHTAHRLAAGGITPKLAMLSAGQLPRGGRYGRKRC